MQNFRKFYTLAFLVILLFLQGIICSQAQNISTRVNSRKDTEKDLNTTSWTADNGNGTFTNPLFYDEFSDPDMIRVGDDYYLTGTTMHAMPGLPLLHSKDLVNWDFICNIVTKLDFSPAYRLEEGKDIYGQGIWAPCIRYHNNKFYVFTNVNGQTTQLYTADKPEGPWTHLQMKKSFHDLSVLFDDDGKTYIVWGYEEIHLAELSDDLLDIKPGSETITVPKGSGAGEGCHFYKIKGKYYITNTNYDPLCYQVCLRADKPTGPYEINVMSAKENMGVGTGWKIADTRKGPPYELIKPVPNFVGSIPMHQGGIIQIQSGEWWGWSMLDFNSVGRVTALSPVTWENDWPYFGLPGNLTRSPKCWIKPATGFSSPPKAVYKRSDDFSSNDLQPLWQWNHVVVENKWSLTERKGFLRLHSLPSKDFWSARNSLTQRAIGPESIVTTEVNIGGLQEGDIAGLALLNLPFAWIGINKKNNITELQQMDQQTGKLNKVELNLNTVWLRVHCNFDTEKAAFSYSLDGKNFMTIGDTTIMVFQLRTFQGVRYTLFNYNTSGKNGGYADFNNFIVTEPRPNGLTKPIPYNQIITLISLADSTVMVNWKHFLRPVDKKNPSSKNATAQFRVLDRGQGRIALQSVSDSGFVTVKGLGIMAEVRIEKQENGNASLFQWQDMLQGDLMLMSLFTNRYLFADPFAKSLLSADSRGTSPDRKDGSCFIWQLVPDL